MRRLSPVEFATVAMMDADTAERIGVAVATLTAIKDPFQFAALRDAANKIARHADHLERVSAEPLPGSLVGQCQPEVHEPAPATSPRAVPSDMPWGLFRSSEHDA